MKKKFVLIGVFFGFIVVLALSLLLSQTDKETAPEKSGGIGSIKTIESLKQASPQSLATSATRK